MRIAFYSLTLSVLLSSGCQAEENVVPAQNERSTDRSKESSDPLERALVQKSKVVGAHLVPASEVFRGRLTRGGTIDFQVVLFAEHCYKAIGTGSGDVLDLDLLLFDPSGVQIAQDSAMDEAPVIGLRSPICPATTGAYRLQVRMFQGSGVFAVRVLGSK